MFALFCTVFVGCCCPPSGPIAAAPFATSVRTGFELSAGQQLSELESGLSSLLQQKEQLEVAMTRASRPGAAFDAAAVLPGSMAAAAGGGARSRHAMLREGEAAMQALEKNIHAHKIALRKLHAQINGAATGR